MAKVESRVTMSFETTITLTEDECGALDALVGYGDEAFLKAFGEKLGEAYMRRHTDGLKSFFRAVRNHVVPALATMQKTRDTVERAGL
jgi:hypothetical protein